MFLKALTPIKCFMTRRGVAAGMRMPPISLSEHLSDRRFSPHPFENLF